jgi:hypothetical protein
VVDGSLSVFTTSTVLLAVLVNPFMYIEKSIISAWTFEAGGPTRLSDPNTKGEKSKTEQCLSLNSVWGRLKFGLDAASSSRNLNTSYEVKNCPNFSSKDKSYVPSRTSYILRGVITILVCYALLDLAELAEQLQPDEAAALISPRLAPLLSRLHEVTVPELISRFITVLMVPLNTWCIIQIAYNTLGILFVVTGFSEVREWRPAFGSLLEVYTLQQFWG